jgi:hypothetical protein
MPRQHQQQVQGQGWQGDELAVARHLLGARVQQHIAYSETFDAWHFSPQLQDKGFSGAPIVHHPHFFVETSMKFLHSKNFDELNLNYIHSRVAG